MAWIYLLIASLFEICWTFCLKFMSVPKLKTIKWSSFFAYRAHWEILMPFAGYIVFGIGNIIFFSMSMKQIPATTALAAWMGLTLIGTRLAEVWFFRQPANLYQFLYMTLIIIGIVGLKQTD